ncbi:hypothetical protein A9L43_20860 [Pseudomonas mosselii]|nr:hypothetical protein A9L43_20860 [Pseudomonas mosselii]
MRMQAFQVSDVDSWGSVVRKGCTNPPCGIFYEHEILPIQCCEGSFVGSLHRGLHRRTQRIFYRVDQREEAQIGSLLIN